ncbi:MAG: NAD(P)-dependent oxidoreductase [Myxococcaceae bacterium]|nr:NAD(P)-dependent oxidoreductase [Myxococcaceae bacterium]MCI0672711.1 NAD(P)-dependent oxidoreductase [Myxococcaceae bacterium]
MKVGFVGLGHMGAPMAASLLAAGHTLAVYNRSREKAEPLRAQGAQVAGSPAEAARGAEVVLTMLADDTAVEPVVFGDSGLLAGLERGAVHVSCSTISVALSERLTDAHARAGQEYVAAPVFGRPEAAQARQLWVVAAGAKRDVDRCLPLLQALGRGLTVLGERPSQANVVKLSGNFLIASMMEALSEAFALTRKAGIAPETFLELFRSVFARSPVFENYAGLIAAEKYTPAGFALRLGLKDLHLALEAARDFQAPMPLASLVHDHFLEGVARGMGALDWSVLGRLAADRAGLSGATQ